MSQEQHPNQFALLKQRRFAPFFWTQFLGAANDNVFKFAFTLMVTYQLQLTWLEPKMAGLVIGALFILPYVLFSATSGQLADKHDKARLMQLVKSLEIAIMAIAAWGFYATNVPALTLSDRTSGPIAGKPICTTLTSLSGVRPALRIAIRAHRSVAVLIPTTPTVPPPKPCRP